MLSFLHTTPEKMGDIGNQSRRDMPSHQFPSAPLKNPSALNPWIPANLPAHFHLLQSPQPSTSSCLLLTNSQPLLPHFPPGPLPFLHFPPSYITAHSIPNSAVSRNPAGFQAAHPSLELACSPTRVPGAPSSHASSQRRLGSPPPASLVRTARRQSAAPRLPGKDEADPSSPHPRPITGPAAAASPVTVSAAPAAYSARVQGGETEACRLPGPSRGSRGCRVCGPAGRRRGSGGSALWLPGQRRPEPSRLRLTIGSGCSALPLIGAGASRPRPGAAWEMESTLGPHPRHAGSWRRPVPKSPRPPWNVRGGPRRAPVGQLPALKREAADPRLHFLAPEPHPMPGERDSHGVVPYDLLQLA